MRRPPWTGITAVFAVELLAIAASPTLFSLQFRYGYEITEENLTALNLNTMLNGIASPCALVGFGTLAALLATRLLRPQPPRIRTPEPEPNDDLEYGLERDPS